MEFSESNAPVRGQKGKCDKEGIYDLKSTGFRLLLVFFPVPYLVTSHSLNFSLRTT